jgi:hypothetical protein
MAWKLAIMMAINEWFHRKRIWFDSNSFIFIEFWWIYSGLHLGKLRRLHIWKAFFFRWKLIFQPPIWQGLPKKILHGAALTSSTPGEPQAFGRILDTNLWSLWIPKVSQKTQKMTHRCSHSVITVLVISFLMFILRPKFGPLFLMECTGSGHPVIDVDL